jgi:enoyl-CoA hydratase/carnithine racemase
MTLVLVDDRDAVRHLVLNRPEKRNALAMAVIEELGEALRDAAAEESVRVVVLRGAGAMFSSGMDTSDLGALAADPSRLHEWRAAILEIWNLCEDMAKPTIAQIHGACLGGAAELALACDLRVMTGDAVIGLVETRIGLIPDVGGCSRLPALVGLGRAKELVMASRLVDGTEAERIGLVNRVVPSGQALAAADGIAAEIAARGPVAVREAKRLIDLASDADLAAGLAAELDASDRVFATDDMIEGAEAFFAKREPQYRGR